MADDWDFDAALGGGLKPIAVSVERDDLVVIFLDEQGREVMRLPDTYPPDQVLIVLKDEHMYVQIGAERVAR